MLTQWHIVKIKLFMNMFSLQIVSCFSKSFISLIVPVTLYVFFLRYRKQVFVLPVSGKIYSHLFDIKLAKIFATWNAIGFIRDVRSNVKWILRRENLPSVSMILNVYHWDIQSGMKLFGFCIKAIFLSNEFGCRLKAFLIIIQVIIS